MISKIGARNYFLLVGITLVSFSSVTDAFGAGENLIQNPSLEIVGTSGVPAQWTKNYWGTPAPTFTYPDTGRTGVGATVTFTKNSTGDARFAPNQITVVGGESYTFSGWYKSTTATEVDAVFTKSNGSKTYAFVASVPSSANVWKQVTATIKIPTGTTKLLVYHLISKTGTLTIDDYSLTKDGTTTPPPPPLQPTLTFSASPATITAGATSTLTWSSSNATSCTATNGWAGTKSVTGSEIVSPTGTTTYQLTCTGSGGSVAKDTTINVKPASTPPPQPPPGTWTEGMVSITLDDSWISQYTAVLPILQSAGMKATFYLTTEPVIEGSSDFMTPANIIDIGNLGHEIAGHTITHADLTTLSAANLAKELTDSKKYLETLTGKTVVSFAYPYGALNTAVKNAVKTAGYTSARGVDDDAQNVATSDTYNLFGSCLEKTMTLDSIKKQIDAAKSGKKWYVICVHEVKSLGGDSTTMTAARFQEIVNYIKSSGIKVVSVKEGRALMAP